MIVCMTGLAASAPAADSSSPGDSEFQIGPSSKIAAEQPLDAKRVAELCKTLSATSASEKERAFATAILTKDKTKSAEFLAANLNPKLAPETETRMGALKGIEVVRPIDQKSSIALGTAAASDPIVEVRNAATSLVKSRGDDFAVRTMLGTLVNTFDTAGNFKDKVVAAAAADALRGLGDKRVYQALLYHVTMELRLTNISAGNLTTRQIDTYSVQNGNQNTFPVQLALPIQTPELSVQRVNTTVIAPAVSALKLLSGEDFGDDWDKWDKWVRKQK
jgi:hypothetical protein